MADVVDEIKERLDIVSVVSQYVSLKKAGRNHKGLCPFHQEKSPSFIVSEEKQIFHCFGCHKGGDVLTFVQELEGLSFPETLKLLAERVGVKYETQRGEAKSAKKDEKESYFEAHEYSAEFFQQQLFESEAGKKVQEYLHRRGLTDDTIREFRLGFAPDSYETLFPYLLKKGVSREVIVNSGFASVRKIGDDHIYDTYRARLMFPVFDYFGRICGFAGRALKNDQMPKYLNSPEHCIYTKRKILYGLSHAKQAVKVENALILVEGYFDMLLPYQHGVRHIAATSGTAMTIEHMRMIRRLTSTVVLSFDTDQAGMDAATRAYALLQTQDLSVRMITELEGKDPADYIAAKSGDFGALARDARDFFEVFIERVIAGEDTTSAAGRKAVLTALLPFLKQMSASAQDHYLRILSRDLHIKVELLYDEVMHFSLPAHHPVHASSSAQETMRPKGRADQLICALLLEYPALFPGASELCDEACFENECKDVYKALCEQYNRTRDAFLGWNFEDELLKNVKTTADVLSLYAQEHYHALSESEVLKEMTQLIERIKTERRYRSLQNITEKMKVAEKAHEKETLRALIEEYRSIQ